MAERTQFNYLYEPEGAELHWDGLKSAPQAQSGGASLAALSAQNASRGATQGAGLGGSQPAPYRPKPKQLTPDELERMADAMMSEHEANYAMGPSVGQERDASGQKLPSWLTDYVRQQ